MASAAAELKVLISILTDGGGVKTLLSDVTKLGQGLKNLPSATPGKNPLDPIKDSARDAQNSLRGVEAAMAKVMQGLRLLAGGFLAFESVRFIKNLADAAARNEVLGTVLHIVGKNAGFASEQLDITDKRVQRLGITATASRQALTQFIQAGFDISKAEPLARAAQDTAVVQGIDSSQAFERLVDATQTMNTLSLRSMGIVLQRDQAEQRFAASIGKTAGQLNLREKQEAFLDATIKKSEILRGTYTAAMGDVGKQLTSLNRLTNELSVSVGNGLLPAYLALVQELSRVLKQLKLVSDVEGIQTDQAKELGSAVGEVAKVLGTVTIFLAEQWKWVASLIGAWASWKFAIAPIAKLLGTIFGQAAVGATSFGGLLRVLGLVSGAAITATGWFVILGAVVIALALKFEPVRAAIGALIGVFLSLASFIKGAFMSALLSLPAAIKSVAEFIKNPWDTEAAQKPWREWASYAKEQIMEVWEWMKATAQRAKEIFTGGPKDATGLDATKRAAIDKSKEDVSILTDKLTASEQKLNAMRSTENRSAKALVDAEAERKKLTVALAAAQTKLDTQLSGSGLSPERIAEENSQLAKAIELKNLNRKITDQDEARQKAGLTGAFTFVGGVEGTTDFGAKLGAFNTSMKEFKELQAKKARGEPAGEFDLDLTAAELTRQTILLGQAVKVAGDQANLRKAVAEFVSAPGFSADQKRRAAGTVGEAAINVEKQLQGETAAATARRKAKFKSDLEPLNERLQLEADMLKSRNQLEEELDNQRLSLGLQSQEEHEAKLQARLKAEGDAEVAIAKNNAENLRKEVVGGYNVAYEDRLDVAERLRKANIKVRELTGAPAIPAQEATKTTAAIAAVPATPSKVELEATAARIRSDAEIEKIKDNNREMELENASFWGGLEETKDKIQEKFRLKHETGDIEGKKKALDRAEEIEVFQADLRFKDEAFGRELAAQQALLNIEQTRLSVANDSGQLTAVESMRRSNILVRQQTALLELQLAQKQARLQYLENVAAVEAARIRQNLEEQGAAADVIEERVRTGVEGLAPGISEARLEAVRLTTEIEKSVTQLDSYGKQLRQVFTSSLGDAISQSMGDFRKAGDAFKSFGQSIKDQITGAIGTDIAGRVTKALVSATSQKRQKPGAPEGELENVPGTSVFDSVFKMLGLGDETKPDGSKGKYFYVWSLNPAPGLYGSTAGTPGAKSPFSSLSELTSPVFGALGSRDLSSQVSQGLSALSSLGKIFGNKTLSARSIAPVFGGLMAEGGLIEGPGTGTSDSILARVSAGEHIMPAAKARLFMPLLEGIRLGRFAFGGIVIPSLIPRQYAMGGMVMDGGAAAVDMPRGPNQMVVSLHPDAMNMTMREWLEREAVRQHGLR